MNRKKMTISGLNKHLGFSVVHIDVINADTLNLIDTMRMESQTLTFEELWNTRGRKAARQLRKAYAVSLDCVHKPVGVRL